MKGNKGITLIALIVTIIIVIIISGISVSLLLGENGLITRAKNAAKLMEKTQREEQEELDNLHAQMQNMISSYNIAKKVNIPNILTGMTPIKFTLPTTSAKGEVVTTNSTDVDWYEYGNTESTRRWANVKTKDGSMWVWIPRYAYKITYYTDETKETISSTKTQYGKIDVVFLIGTTDKYYDENGEIKTAQRQKEASEVIDTTLDYTVHPAFTSDVTKGGWNKELTGIWVAKFEAGYASGNNDAIPVKSNVNYTQTTSYVSEIESLNGSEKSETARNWLDGIYGETETKISYPVFMPTTYSMNYTNINDKYNISKALETSGNPYGLVTSANSHLMKNSEWGAVAYLSYSEYGTNGREIAVNNASLNSNGRKRTEAMTSGGDKLNPDSVYAITGCTDGSTENNVKVVLISNINNTIANTPTTEGIYTWNQVTGGLASTTQNMYGIYDFSGGLWERTAGFINNGKSNLTTYGNSLKTETGVTTAGTGTSTAYVTIYNYKTGSNNDTAANNYIENASMYGDAIAETSIAGNTSNSSWNGDYSSFPSGTSLFFMYGSRWSSASSEGCFAFYHSNGSSGYSTGFRCVLAGY